jgi:hypothetical protein
MDTRDKHLQRHMQKRKSLASRLPLEKQQCWAGKCQALAAHQHRTAFYLMAALWCVQLSKQP